MGRRRVRDHDREGAQTAAAGGLVYDLVRNGR